MGHRPFLLLILLLIGGGSIAVALLLLGELKLSPWLHSESCLLRRVGSLLPSEAFCLRVMLDGLIVIELISKSHFVFGGS